MEYNLGKRNEAGLEIEMIKVEGGIFKMGKDQGEKNEKPAHQVKLESFYIGKYPIAQFQWEVVMGSNPSYFKGCDLCPVEKVSWNDVQEFLKKLNDENPDKYYRLPTEAEWEYAARGGPLSKGKGKGKKKGFKYSGGNDIHEVAWYVGNAEGKTHPVGQKQPNELGIHDMSGNVWEWCLDKYSNSYYQICKDQGVVHNPKGPEDGKNIVVRGGSWVLMDPWYCRVFARYSYPPHAQFYHLGFRLALSV